MGAGVGDGLGQAGIQPRSMHSRCRGLRDPRFPREAWEDAEVVSERRAKRRSEVDEGDSIVARAGVLERM